MSIIRTLSVSESNEQRDREKAKLEKEYAKSDQQLDELIQKHHEELSQVMQVTRLFLSSHDVESHIIMLPLNICQGMSRCELLICRIEYVFIQQ